MKQIRLDDGPLSLRFEHRVDRWSHQFHFTPEAVNPQTGKRFTIPDSAHVGPESGWLASIEGDSGQDWPGSPPLQAVDLHQLEGQRQAILGLGKAGKAHWSASFARPDSAPAPFCIQVELACLNHAPASSPQVYLASSYRLAPEIKILDSATDPSRVCCLLGEHELEIAALGGDDWSSRIQLSGPQLLILPNRIRSEPRQPTRWGYRVAIKLRP